MLRCTIEIIPFGDETRARPLGIVEIANDATGDSALGNYIVVLKKTPPWEGALKATWKDGKFHAQKGDRKIVTGEVHGFDRINRGVYDLLFRALRACGLEKRNP